MTECIHEMPREWCASCRTVQRPAELQQGPDAAPTPMLAGVDPWDEYDRWNSAITRVVYGVHMQNQPVYLDLDDDLLGKAATQMNPAHDVEHATARFCESVRATLALVPGKHDGGAFAPHRRRVETWKIRSRKGMSADDPPPVIALLAAFALAAEQMKRDEFFRANAYYPRLMRLLEVPPRSEGRFKAGFMRDSEAFWQLLNDWLIAMNGRMGKPTAETVASRYVGIPMSQALIRDADRQSFVQLFEESRLDPGLALAAADMTPYLARWIAGGHASAAIRKLWRSPSGKTLLAEAAAQVLSQWDGCLPGGSGRERVLPAPVLTANIIKNGFRGKALRLGFAVRAGSAGPADPETLWTIDSAQGRPKVRLTPINDRFLAADLPREVDPSSLVMGSLSISLDHGDPNQKINPRRPQPLIVMSYLSEAGTYVEVDRVRTMERHLLLVNLDAERVSSGRLDFDEALASIAEPGYTREATIAGLPNGWVLYRDVTVVRPHLCPDPMLEPLIPAQTSALVVAGGLRLPGHAACWHADAGLTITAAAYGAARVEVSLLRAENDEEIEAWSSDVEEIAISTASLALTSGRYRVVAKYQIGTDRRESATTFTLCDSEEPRLRGASAPLAYDLSDPLGTVSASHDTSIEARPPAVQTTADRSSATSACPEPVWWSLEAIEYDKDVLAASVDASCAITGAHRWAIETHQKGMKADRGQCRTCGRIAFFRPGGKKKMTDEEAAHAARLQQVAPLRRITLGEPAASVSGETILDGVLWLGGGSPEELARLIRQVYDSALTVDEVTRIVETVGHINVAADRGTLAAREWAVTARSLCGLPDGTWLTVGGWTRADISALRDVAVEYGGRAETDFDDWLPRHAVTGLDGPSAASVAEAMDAACIPDAGRSLLTSLPPLSAVIPALSTVSAEGIFNAERFDVAQGRWIPVLSVGKPGAYRVRNGFVSSYYVRTAADVEAGRLRRADYRTVKHLAARERPIVGYDADASRLFVPLGADLPGLYGRALSLLSGRPPRRVGGKPLLAYSAVDHTTATSLGRLLRG